MPSMRRRLAVWQRCPGLTEQTARIDGDGTLVPTTGACKEGMDISYNGIWGYHPLVVSLANTGEPLFLKNRSGNRPSHEGVIPYFDKAIALCRRAGFRDILLRGDTDFALTTAFDRWTDARRALRLRVRRHGDHGAVGRDRSRPPCTTRWCVGPSGP